MKRAAVCIITSRMLRSYLNKNSAIEKPSPLLGLGFCVGGPMWRHAACAILPQFAAKYRIEKFACMM